MYTSNLVKTFLREYTLCPLGRYSGKALPVDGLNGETEKHRPAVERYP